MHVPVQVRHELHKLREKAREAADDQKFAVQRTIAGFHQQQNSSLQEFQKCQALRAEKDLELASLKDQEAVQRERAREQRAEMEAEFEAQLAPMREGAPPPLCTALPCVSGAHSRPPSVSRCHSRGREPAACEGPWRVILCRVCRVVPTGKKLDGGLAWSEPQPKPHDGVRLFESTKARSHFGTASSGDLTRPWRCFPGFSSDRNPRVWRDGE